MLVAKKADSLTEFVASDGCRLAEVIHPAKDGTSQGVSLARAWLEPGAATSPHTIDLLEIYYVLSGQGIMHAGDQRIDLQADVCVHLPPRTVQWVENTSPDKELVFLCVCHPAYDPELDKPA